LNPDGISDPITWSNYIQDERFETNLDIKISKNGRDICTIAGTNPTFNIEPLVDDEKFYHSFLVCGLVEWFFSYSESKTPTSQIKSINSDGDLAEWFSKNLNKKILVVDTNIIIDRVFSSLKFLGHDFIKNIEIRIPRLSILELERMGNEGSDLKKNKTSLGYGELMYLKNNNKQTMRELNIETLTGFSNIAKDKKTDSWIRREIKDARRRDLIAQVVNNYVLITSDLVNSFSAVAEDIDTIHVSRIHDWKNRIRNPTLEQIGRVIITLSVLYENILVTINSKKFTVIGIWEGKTIWDWGSEHANYKHET